MVAFMTWAQKSETCNARPIQFKENIRPPDAWEATWEAAWPEASDALQVWRSEQFDNLTSMWCGWNLHASALMEMTHELELPPSAAYLAWWSTCADASRQSNQPFDLELAVSLLKKWQENPRPIAAMKQAYASSHSLQELNTWASLMRTGMRLMENLELPHIHVVQSGETVFGIARHFQVPPKCLAQRNRVWDNIQPGDALIIPNVH